MYRKFGVQFQLRIVNGFMIVCLDELLLFWPAKEDGFDIEYNLFCVYKIESISPLSLNFIFLFCKYLLHSQLCENYISFILLQLIFLVSL